MQYYTIANLTLTINTLKHIGAACVIIGTKNTNGNKQTVSTASIYLLIGVKVIIIVRVEFNHRSGRLSSITIWHGLAFDFLRLRLPSNRRLLYLSDCLLGMGK